MLVVEELHVQYGRIAALRGVSVRVEPGELVAVIGPNGAGKSTLLHAIAGLLPVKEGRITFEDSSIRGEEPHRIVRKGISLVPEGRRIFGRLTVEENLALGATVQSEPSLTDEGLQAAFELFPVLKDLRRARASTLSGGEQQQLAIARALLARPRLLLLDEPSLGLAPLIVDRVFSSLQELRVTEGLTILLVEQNATAALDVADRTYVLRTGSLEFEGDSQAFRENREVEALYLGL